MKISVVRPSDLDTAEQGAWRSIQAGEPCLDNPFLTPEFTVVVGSVRATTRVAVLESNGSAAFFPFERQLGGIGRPVGAGMSDFQALIIPRDVHVDAQHVLRACNLAIWRFDHLLASQAPVLGARCLEAPSPVIDLGQGYGPYLEERKRASRGLMESTARKARKLARERGAVRFEHDDPDHHRLDQLIGWKRQQYRRTGVPDVLAPAAARELLHRLLDTRGRTFSGLLSVLYSGERPVAAHMGLRTQKGLVWWLPGYDVDFAGYSPGFTLILRLAEWAAADGVEWIDLGKGAEPYKQRLKSHDRLIADGYVAQPFAGPLFEVLRGLRTRRKRGWVTAGPSP